MATKKSKNAAKAKSPAKSKTIAKAIAKPKAKVAAKAVIKPKAKVVKKAKVVEKSKPIANLNGEVWKKVSGSDNDYRVSNKGRVKSYFFDTVNGKLIKGKNVNGYLAVDMVVKGQRKLAYIHNLVASSFVRKPSPKHIRVAHADWKKQNNNAENLMCITQKESYARNAEFNAKKFGAFRSVNAKLSAEKVKDMRKEMKAGKTQASLAKKYKVSLMTISRIATGKSWSSVK
ncbi:MAG: HNH endonuclease [Bacteroidetes bacterium]|nr:HNH endonuclease [Bacteroidota bacterium]MBL0053773.1 HNH endonuclease [Bacteroidota bacterium]